MRLSMLYNNINGFVGRLGVGFSRAFLAAPAVDGKLVEPIRGGKIFSGEGRTQMIEGLSLERKKSL